MCKFGFQFFDFCDVCQISFFLVGTHCCTNVVRGVCKRCYQPYGRSNKSFDDVWTHPVAKFPFSPIPRYAASIGQLPYLTKDYHINDENYNDWGQEECSSIEPVIFQGAIENPGTQQQLQTHNNSGEQKVLQGDADVGQQAHVSFWFGGLRGFGEHFDEQILGSIHYCGSVLTKLKMMTETFLNGLLTGSDDL